MKYNLSMKKFIPLFLLVALAQQTASAKRPSQVDGKAVCKQNQNGGSFAVKRKKLLIQMKLKKLLPL